MIKKSSHGQRGFGLFDLMLTVAAFSIAMAAIMSLARQLKTQTASENIGFIESQRSTILALVMDGRSWSRTVSMNQPPPTVLPPVPFTPFPPGTGNPLNLFNSTNSNTPVINSTNDRAGFTTQGLNCTSFSRTTASPECPLRYELRWFIVTPGVNPIVAVTATLMVSPGTLKFNPMIYSYDYQVLDPVKTMNPITRQLNASWVAQGALSSANLKGLTFQGVPNCSTIAGFVAGTLCNTVGATCICDTSICPGGQELYQCE